MNGFNSQYPGNVQTAITNQYPHNNSNHQNTAANNSIHPNLGDNNFIPQNGFIDQNNMVVPTNTNNNNGLNEQRFVGAVNIVNNSDNHGLINQNTIVNPTGIVSNRLSSICQNPVSTMSVDRRNNSFDN